MNPQQSDPFHSPAEPQTRRLFLAIALPGDLCAAVADLSRRLQKGAQFTALQASWVPAANYHLTLHFLGPVDSTRVASLQDALRTLQGTIRPFQLRFRGLGYFPHAKAPRVLWLGVPQPPDDLQRLVARTAEVIRATGLDLQHDNFHPHLTLARFRSLKGTAAFVNIARNYADAAPGNVEVQQIVLMESLFTKGAPEYRPVLECPFEDPGPMATP